MSLQARTTLAAIALSAVLVSLSACAQDSSRQQQMAQKAKDRFAAADLNHDGFLSRDEAQKVLEGALHQKASPTRRKSCGPSSSSADSAILP